MTSGLPVNLNYSPAAAFQVSTVVTHRPNITGEIYADDPTAPQWFNPANIVVPTDSSQPFGNAPRNAARGPALYSMDLGLHKDLRDRRQPAAAVPAGSVQRPQPRRISARRTAIAPTRTSDRSRRWRFSRGRCSSA